jgi:hypothetical protein
LPHALDGIDDGTVPAKRHGEAAAFLINTVAGPEWQYIAEQTIAVRGGEFGQVVVIDRHGVPLFIRRT